MKTISISLPESMSEFIESEVAAGKYGTADDFIRGLVHEAQLRRARERVDALLLEGINSGDPIEVTPEYWAEMRRWLQEQSNSRAQSS